MYSFSYTLGLRRSPTEFLLYFRIINSTTFIWAAITTTYQFSNSYPHILSARQSLSDFVSYKLYALLHIWCTNITFKLHIPSIILHLATYRP
ncbi:hypothetical protein VTL71DRAFT_8392 [Oculimacula yallundae]|uniref:Uncharacterized protein n=1 Tax=Oculimacula yallundae TaxID=86028 RepID=A0ABR4CZV2_9HELO